MAATVATRIKVEPQTPRDALMDDPPCQRKMERAGIMGDTPF